MTFHVTITPLHHRIIHNQFIQTGEQATIANYFYFLKQKYHATAFTEAPFCLEFDTEKDMNWFLLNVI